MIKKICVTLFIWAFITFAIVFIYSFVFEKLAYSEVPIKYNSKMCKMEIITSIDIKNRNAKEIVERKVLEFCKDKYIYNIEIAIDNGKYVYVIMYNDMVE